MRTQRVFLRQTHSSGNLLKINEIDLIKEVYWYSNLQTETSTLFHQNLHKWEYKSLKIQNRILPKESFFLQKTNYVWKNCISNYLVNVRSLSYTITSKTFKCGVFEQNDQEWDWICTFCIFYMKSKLEKRRISANVCFE